MHSKPDSDRSRRRANACKRVATTLFCVALTAVSFAVGCKSLNEDPRNERFWFPTLEPPSQQEREARSRTFVDGGDPYVDAQVGPRSLDTRPRGWDISRSRTAACLNVAPDINEDD